MAALWHYFHWHQVANLASSGEYSNIGHMEVNHEQYSSVWIRKLPAWVEQSHRRAAEGKGQSLEGYLRHLLTQSALEAQREFAGHITHTRKKLAASYSAFVPDMTALVRQERDAT